MDNMTTNQFHPDYLVTPGEILEEYLESFGMSQAELSRRTGLTQKTVNEIIKGKAPISYGTAIKLERVLNRPAHFWVSLESNYQEDRIRQQEREHLKADAEWVSAFPVKKMAEFGWLPKAKDKKDKYEQLESLLNFFGIASPKQWDTVWDDCRAITYRQSARNAVSCEAISAWLRRGELEARQVDCPKYDSKAFRDALGEARALTLEANMSFLIPCWVELCARVGVILVFVRELPRTGVYGATRWIDGKPIIQLTLRGKSHDQLWFTFFHEACHVIKHGRKSVFLELEDAQDRSAEEDEADIFAQDHLIPRSSWDKFVKQDSFTYSDIQQFSSFVEIAAGIVVGRLQHERLIPFNLGNDMKIRYIWE